VGVRKSWDGVFDAIQARLIKIRTAQTEVCATGLVGPCSSNRKRQESSSRQGREAEQAGGRKQHVPSISRLLAHKEAGARTGQRGNQTGDGGNSNKGTAREHDLELKGLGGRGTVRPDNYPRTREWEGKQTCQLVSVGSPLICIR